VKLGTWLVWCGLGVLAGPAWSADTLYHCKAYSGGQFWSKQHCQEREALVDRIVNVPSGLKWSEQVRLAEQGSKATAKELARSERTAEADDKATRQQVKARQRHERRCTELQQDMDRQDSMARQGASGRKLERIAKRKQDLQERRQLAGC
jgi:hypothetical protein